MLAVPTPAAAARLETLKRVDTLIKAKFGKKYSVSMFGSSSYGVSSASSDLDLVIQDSSQPKGVKASIVKQLPSIYKIEKVARILRVAGYRNVKPIPAVVPIVKFTDPKTRLQCDINVNDRLGLMNTELIKQYFQLHPLLQPMVALVKLWAKPLGLNNPSKPNTTTTFNSYALALMIIGFMQMKQLLPNLQAHLPPAKGMESELVWSRKPAVLCDVRFHRPEDHQAVQETELPSLARAWFYYWGFQHQYGTQMTSIRHGGIVSRPAPCLKWSDSNPTGQIPDIGTPAYECTEIELEASEINDKWAQDPICVVDPFIRTKNVAGSVGKRSVRLFQRSCQEAALRGLFEGLGEIVGSRLIKV
ncbi:hypothetical protein AMATHDRAFT_58801 [Amanita thiersii Skay4041]|uniref:Poly(A) RNA polymerase mitochondrial-like central palm domain-containing protein n=1 Tax=Amanita thiersii Skay4041 TaxID=703135 RepID=A0A2A9NTQ9_9AGAR|nr:hypothetical protein AMATHDRAFT_58801 [Amanita thiersii Skay4041]